MALGDFYVKNKRIYKQYEKYLKELSMKILVLSASTIGKTTQTATEAVFSTLKNQYGDEHQIKYINLQEKEMIFSDGRNYLDYQGDTGEVVQAIMASDVLVLGTPIFQASIPASLKNIFDLLPQNALQFKTVSMVATAGSEKHFLIPEIQLKPILSYMKANIVPNYVFLLDTETIGDEITSDDVYFRIDTLIEDTMVLAETYQEIWRKQEESYGF
jgi:FMN reductase